VIERASSLKNSSRVSRFTAEQVNIINELIGQDFLLIDDALGKASERAEAHNKTSSDKIDVENGNAEMLNSTLDFFEEYLETRKSRKLIPRLKAILCKEDAFAKTLARLEEQIEKGYASLDDDLFFRRKVEPHHAKKLKELLGHERRELRKLAKDGWLRINPGEAEKQAVRSWDWLTCAENWLVVDKTKRESTRCVREAEKHAEDFTAWSACVDFWKDEIKDKAEARRCLMIAEENVEHTDFGVVGNLLSVGRYWIEFNDRERAKNALLRAESISDAVDREMVWLSQMWRENFNDFESAKKCLRKAELLAALDPSGLDMILEEWKTIGDQEELERFKSANRSYLAD